MALLDTDRGQIIIRIAYDGPALSGKTTTLRALADSLGQGLFSGEEAEGRTLYFDWLDYTGGRFEGYPIRCQVVSVPGQRSLRTRRERLLRRADAVVFVADSRRSSLEASARMLASVRSLFGEGEGPRPGIVVQANKRDSTEAAEMDAVREALSGDGSSAVTGSVATVGEGLRETFVLAVRLALDRARELIRTSALPQGTPEIDSPEALLHALRNAEGHPGASADVASTTMAGDGVARAVAAEARRDPPREAWPDEECPRLSPEERSAALVRAQPELPSADVPGGMIWPPIEGRIFLHEAVAMAPPIAPGPDGVWMAAAAWCVASHATDVFLEAEAARVALLEWARWHAAGSGSLSPRRCILAAGADDGAWRLWQVVRGERTLRIALGQALACAEPADVARGLVEQCRALAEALTAFEALGLRCSVDNLGFLESGRLVYVGLAPRLEARYEAPTVVEGSFEQGLRAVLAPAILETLSADVDVPAVLNHLTPLAAAAGIPRVAEPLAAILIGG